MNMDNILKPDTCAVMILSGIAVPKGGFLTMEKHVASLDRRKGTQLSETIFFFVALRCSQWIPNARSLALKRLFFDVVSSFLTPLQLRDY
jgi:hypothetical protein